MPAFLTPINLQKHELQNAVIQNLATAPASPIAGQVYYNTAETRYKIYDGSNWRNLFNDDDDFNTLTASADATDSDILHIYDVSAEAYRKITRGNLIAGTGGEANTGSNIGTDGIGVFKAKAGIDLQFRNIAPASAKVTVVSNVDDIDIDIVPANINHSAINDDEAAKHRTINDSGTTTADLWSANKITSELSGKSDTGHNHSGVYEPIDASILRQADVDDTPVDGVTTAPVSSNWAYDHANATNPHSVSKSDVGLGNVTNEAQIPLTQKGAVNGVAELDAAGTVPSAQLPSFVDDVVEGADFASLPGTGESGKIYVTLNDNKTYRWSGSAYVEISSSLALGETSETAYRGDRGKTAYDHSQAAHAPADAEANVQSDWNAASGDAQILNKPAILDTSDITFENLDANGDVGTGADQVAAGDHTHSFSNKYAANVGDGTSTSITVTHNLNTRDVTVMLYKATTPYDAVIADIAMSTVNSITLTFASAPTANQYRVVVVG